MVRNLRPSLPTLDTRVNGSAAERPDFELGDISDHIGKLRQVTLTTQTLVNLLGGQLQGLSVTVPVLRGFEILEKLGERSKERREGVQSAFESLRTFIEREKGLFYTRNAKVIEEIIQKRVVEGIKRKLPIVLKEQLGRYEDQLKTNRVLADEVKQAMATASARTANGLRSIQYPNEQVDLIPPHPDWDGITLGDLKTIGGPAVAKLASDQGLTPLQDSPDPEYARTYNLNMILRHLGVQYRAIPSWNGILLTSVSGKVHP